MLTVFRKKYPALVLGATTLLVWISAIDYLQGGAPYGDDLSAHYALSVHISNLIAQGQTNFFWENMNLGLPLFASYQPLPSLFTGLVIALLSWFSSLTVFKALIILIWSTLPITWYKGARWVGMSQTQALILGLLTLTTHDAWHVGFTFSSTAYEGLYTQAWGLWFFPLAVGAFNQCVFLQKMDARWASLIVALTVMSHLFTGVLTAMACGCMLMAQPSHIRSSLRQLISITLLSFAICSFWLVPLLLTREYLGGLPWMNHNYDGWALEQTLQNFISGELLDAKRWPILTILSLAALAFYLRRIRRSFATQACVLFALLTWFLIGGRETWGEIYAALPLHKHVNPIRYITALQALALIACANLCAELWNALSLSSNKRFVLALGCFGVAAAFQFNFLERTLRTLPLFEAPLHRVAGELAADPDHRFMVDGQYSTGSHFHRDLLPLLSNRPQLQSYSLGYHATFSTYYAEHMKPTPTGLRLFNVSTLVTRNNAEVPQAFEFYRGIGKYKIYRVPGAEKWGYFDLVWPGPNVHGSLRAMRETLSKLAPELFEKNMVAILKSEPGQDVRIDTHPDNKPAPIGQILSTSRGADQFQARVEAEAGAWLLFKVNYFPFWKATINGTPTTIHHVAPNFMAVELPGGIHEVSFNYENPWLQKIGAVISLIWLCVWPLWSWRSTRRKVAAA